MNPDRAAAILDFLAIADRLKRVERHAEAGRMSGG
jgi:hypothetical protein